MRKYILHTGMTLMILFTADLLPAQTTGESVTVNISAEVQQSAIELVTLRPMDFSNIDRTEGEIYIDPVLSPRTGKMVATGNPDAIFEISFLQNRQLTSQDGTGSITFDYEVAGNSVDEQSSSELLDVENRELFFNSDGEYFLWVGGRVNLQQAEPGLYEGEFTLEIEYN